MSYDGLNGAISPPTQLKLPSTTAYHEYSGPIDPQLEQSAVSILSCVAILTVLCVFGVVCLLLLWLRYRQVTQRHVASSGDGWMSVCLLIGAGLCYAAILPLGARVIYILNYEKYSKKSPGSLLTEPERQVQCGAWLLSLGLSLVFGVQSVLSWRRWKIQRMNFFIRFEYLASIVLLIVLVDMAQLTLWQTSDPFHCTADRKKPGIINCNIQYLPLWLLGSLVHKGVLLFSTVVYSWRMQLQSTSRSIMRSISGCSLINASLCCVAICMLGPLVCIANDWPALQHLSLSILVVLTTTAGVSLHFIPGIMNAIDERNDQIVRLRRPSAAAPGQTRTHDQSNRNSRLILDTVSPIKSSLHQLNHHHSQNQLNRHLSKASISNPKSKALVRLGGLLNNEIPATREGIQHHKSCSFLEQNSSIEAGRFHENVRNEPARLSHISTSTAPTSSQYHQHNRQSKRSSRKSQSPIAHAMHHQHNQQQQQQQHHHQNLGPLLPGGGLPTRSVKNVADTVNNTLESNQLFETWL